jgi:hypothetical protein
MGRLTAGEIGEWADGPGRLKSSREFYLWRAWPSSECVGSQTEACVGLCAATSQSFDVIKRSPVRSPLRTIRTLEERFGSKRSQGQVETTIPE